MYAFDRLLNGYKGRFATDCRDCIKVNYPNAFADYTVKDNCKKRMFFRFWQLGGGFNRNFWNAKAIHNSIDYIGTNPVRK